MRPEPFVWGASGRVISAQVTPTLRIRVLVDGSPMAGRPFFARFGDLDVTSGTTDGDGFLELDVPAVMSRRTGVPHRVGEGYVIVKDTGGHDLLFRFHGDSRRLPGGEKGDLYRAVMLGKPASIGAALWDAMMVGNNTLTEGSWLNPLDHMTSPGSTLGPLPIPGAVCFVGPDGRVHSGSAGADSAVAPDPSVFSLPESDELIEEYGR